MRPCCTDHLPRSVGTSLGGGSPHHGPWFLTTKTVSSRQSLGSSGGQGVGVSSISSTMRPGEPGLCCGGDQLLLGGRAVCDHLFPWFRLLLVVLWVPPQPGDGAPLLLGWRAPVREGSSPLGYSLGWGEGKLACIWVGMGCCMQAPKFRDACVVLVLEGLPPRSPLASSHVRDAGFPKRTPPMPAGQACLRNVCLCGSANPRILG